MSRIKTLLVELAWRHGQDSLVSLGGAGLLAAMNVVDPGSAALMSVDIRRPGKMGRQIARSILRRVIKDDEGVVVGLGAYVWNDELVRETVASLRNLGFRGRIVVGGPQVTYGYDPEADYPGADIFVRGYAEQALTRIARGDVHGIRGVQVAGQPTDSGPCALDLAACPSPYLTNTLAVGNGQNVVRWETQRGCPYRCAYCQHRDPDLRANVQTASFERLAGEMDLFCLKGVRQIKVIDPVFNRGMHGVRVLEALKARGFNGSISVQCRPELVTESFIKACAGLHVLPELGVQTIHPEEGRLVDRHVAIDRISRAFELLNGQGIPYAVTIIYGLPGQTVESFRQTIDFCLGHKVPEIRAFPLMLLKGSALEMRKKELGLHTGPGPMATVVRSPSFDETDVAYMRALSRELERTAGRHPCSVDALSFRLGGRGK